MDVRVLVMDVRTKMLVYPRFRGSARSFWTGGRPHCGISGPKSFSLGCFFRSWLLTKHFCVDPAPNRKSYKQQRSQDKNWSRCNLEGRPQKAKIEHTHTHTHFLFLKLFGPKSRDIPPKNLFSLGTYRTFWPLGPSRGRPSPKDIGPKSLGLCSLFLPDSSSEQRKQDPFYEDSLSLPRIRRESIRHLGRGGG